MKKINISFIILELGAGGQERQMSYAIKSLIKNGIKPILFIWSGNKYWSQEYGIIKSGAEIIMLEGNFIKKIYNIRSTLKHNKIQIFQSWSILTNIILFLSTIGSKIITIGALRMTLFGHYINKARPLSSLKVIIQLISVKNIICNSYSALEDMKILFKNIPFVKKRLFVLHNRTRINFKNISVQKKKKFFSVSCGSLIARKNIDFIIDVVSILKSYYPNYVHAHAGGNGDMYEELLRKVKLNDLKDNFLLLGELQNLDKFYADGELYIHSSKYEGTPNTLIEAMSSGLPIITTDWGDANHFVLSNENGYIITEKDPSIWAEKIRSILSNKSLLDKMGSVSLEVASKKLNLKNLYPDLIKIYSKIINEKI